MSMHSTLKVYWTQEEDTIILLVAKDILGLPSFYADGEDLGEEYIQEEVIIGARLPGE